MTNGQRGQARQQTRAELGRELRRLRVLAEMSAGRLAAELGMAQSTLTRVESGKAPVRGSVMRKWVAVTTAAGAEEPDMTRLNMLLRLAADPVAKYSSFIPQSGLAGVQAEIAREEQTARVIRNYQSGLVPGLLQTSEYARRVLRLARPDASDEEVGRAVVARMERQAILSDSSHLFEFVLLEAALRWSPAPAAGSALPAQLERIASVASMDNVTVSVIPLGGPTGTLPWMPFILYDDRPGGGALVVAEIPHARLQFDSPDDVEVYRRQLELLRLEAVGGVDAIHLIRQLAGRLALC